MKNKYIVTKKARYTNKKGGTDLIILELIEKGLFKFVEQILGKRAPRAEYSYGEIILLIFVGICHGARSLQNMDRRQTKKSLFMNPHLQKCPSPDTISYVCRELAVLDQRFHVASEDSTYVDHEINRNPFINALLMQGCLYFGLLEPSVCYMLDFDTTEIPSKMKGSRKYWDSYGRKAYAPAIGTINNFPVFIENRNGNTSSKTRIGDTVLTAVSELRKAGINVDRVRIDNAGYVKDCVSMLCEQGLKFYIRAESRAVRKCVKEIRSWNRIDNRTEISEGTYEFAAGRASRIVVTRELEDGAYKYWGIITNDEALTVMEVLVTYQMRGQSEQLFRELKSDFCWRPLAQRELRTNAVFLGLTAFCYILFQYVKRVFGSLNGSLIKSEMTLKTFRDAFIDEIETTWDGNELILLEG